MNTLSTTLTTYLWLAQKRLENNHKKSAVSSTYLELMETMKRQKFSEKEWHLQTLNVVKLELETQKKHYWEFNCMAHFTGGNSLGSEQCTKYARQYPPEEGEEATSAGLLSKAADGVAIATIS